MMLKIGLLLLIVGFITLPVSSGSGIVSLTTGIFMSGLFMIGLYTFRNAECLSEGSAAIKVLYLSAPLLLPLVAVVIRALAMQ